MTRIVRVPRALSLLAAVATTAALLAPTPLAAQRTLDPDRVTGTWQGTLRTPMAALRLGLTISGGSAGELTGVLTSIDQGGVRLPATIALVGDSMIANVPAAGIRYAAVVAAGDSLRGAFHQGPAALPLAMSRVAALSVASPPRRTQTPVPPFPYRTEEVAFPSVPGVTLAGTLTLPAGAGPFPTVVFVTGSGPQDRDETLLGHHPFLVIADHLARHGIASLRYDDRGTARSTGNFAAGTTADFADDAEAAVRFARTRPGVDAAHVGILGHSEGGLIGPIVAARSRDVAFVVMMAGPGVRGDAILALQGQLISEAGGALHDAAGMANNARLFAAIADGRDSADAAHRARAVADTMLAAASEPMRTAMRQRLDASLPALLTPWMRYFLAFDPQPVLRRVTVPVLAMNGTLDLQVPATQNLPAIDAALRAAGNRDYRTVALPGLNHLFQTATTGSPAEYERIEETVAPAALDLMTTWILAHAR